MVIVRQDNLDLHFPRPGDGRVEVVDFEPKKHAISVGLLILVADGSVMVLHLPPMQLQNQAPLHGQPFILGAAVGALATEEPLIPATARLDITYTDKGLCMHGKSFLTESFSGKKHSPSPRPSPPRRGRPISVAGAALPTGNSFQFGTSLSPLQGERVRVRARQYSDSIVTAWRGDLPGFYSFCLDGGFCM